MPGIIDNIGQKLLPALCETIAILGRLIDI